MAFLRSPQGAYDVSATALSVIDAAVTTPDFGRLRAAITDDCAEVRARPSCRHIYNGGNINTTSRAFLTQSPAKNPPPKKTANDAPAKKTAAKK